jgi:hypothetical protein
MITALRLLVILMLLFLAGTHIARATPLGPPTLDKCFPLAEKPEAMARAREMGTVQSFDADSSKKLIATINDQEPKSDWEATTVDLVKRNGNVFIFFSDDKQMCLVERAKEEFWERLADQAFGQGS